MHFVRLVDQNDTLVVVNVDRIAWYTTTWSLDGHQSYTQIHLGATTVTVKETVQEVMRAINELEMR